MIQEAGSKEDIKVVPVHFDFVANPELGALALAEEQDFIGVNWGTVPVLIDFFNRMMAFPEILPEVSDIDLEGIMQPQQRAIPKLPTSALEVEARGGPPILIDPRRNSFAGILIGGAFEFLVAHELAHIRNGHVDLMKEMGATGLEDSSRPRPAPALTAQTLEMDADCGAIVRTVNRALDLSDRFSGVPEDRRWMFFDALGTYERATLTVMMSAYAVFRLFDESYWCERDLECRKHPPAPIRQIMTLATAAEHLKRHEQPGLSERFADLAGQAVETIERACALMLGQTELAVDGLRGARSAQSERHARGLLAHWKELRPRLEHLKRGGTLAD